MVRVEKIVLNINSEKIKLTLGQVKGLQHVFNERIGDISSILTLDQDDNGLYLVTDNSTTVYGDGLTPVEAVIDYFVSLREYQEIMDGQTDGNGQCDGGGQSMTALPAIETDRKWH